MLLRFLSGFKLGKAAGAVFLKVGYKGEIQARYFPFLHKPFAYLASIFELSL
mgnify:CR=1 FL=1